MENDEKKYGDIDRIGWQTRYGKKKIYNKWLLGESNSPFNFNTRIYAINSLEWEWQEGRRDTHTLNARIIA